MENRKQETYYKIFGFLVDSLDNYQPTSLMSDFELAPRNSCSSAFPLTEQRGCYFHFMQSVCRHIRSDSKLYKEYQSDSYFAFHLRHLPALAFVREEDVIMKFEEILAMPFYTYNKEILEDFVAYFERAWIGVKKRSRRVAPIFPIKLWNIHNSVNLDWERTKNSCESFNSSFQSLLSASKPTTWKLIEGLKKQQHITSVSVVINV